MARPLVAAVLATTFATFIPAQAAPTRAAKPQGEPAAGADLQQELTALRKELRDLRRALDQLKSEQTPRAATPKTETWTDTRTEKAEKVDTRVETKPKTKTRTFTFSSDNDGKWVEVTPKDGEQPLRAIYRTGDGNKPMVLRTDGTTINLAPGIYQVETGEKGETKVFTFDAGSGKLLKAKAGEPKKADDGKCSCGCDCDCCKQKTTTEQRTVVSVPQSLFAPRAMTLRQGAPLLGTTSGVLAPPAVHNFTLVAPDRNCSPTRARVVTPMTAPVAPTPLLAPMAPRAPKPPKAPKVKDADKSKLISV